MGVWIETAKANDMRAAGLVTPFVGVWIETSDSIDTAPRSRVTPFVGVWIETDGWDDAKKEVLSHTLRGCVD